MKTAVLACVLSALLAANANADERPASKEALIDLKMQLEELRQTLGDQHPRVMSVKKRMEALREQSGNTLRAALEEKVAQLHRARAAAAQLEHEVVQLKERVAAEEHAKAAPKRASSTDEKLDAILHRLERMERRLAELEKAKRE